MNIVFISYNVTRLPHVIRSLFWSSQCTNTQLLSRSPHLHTRQRSACVCPCANLDWSTLHTKIIEGFV